MLFFPNEEINVCYRNAHSTEGFCALHSAKPEQLLRGTHGRQEANGHPLHLPGIDILAEEQGNGYSWGGEAAWPGGVRAGQDLYQREGNLAVKEAEAASGGAHVTRTDSH